MSLTWTVPVQEDRRCRCLFLLSTLGTNRMLIPSPRKSCPQGDKGPLLSGDPVWCRDRADNRESLWTQLSHLTHNRSLDLCGWSVDASWFHFLFLLHAVRAFTFALDSTLSYLPHPNYPSPPLYFQLLFLQHVNYTQGLPILKNSRNHLQPPSSTSFLVFKVWLPERMF